MKISVVMPVGVQRGGAEMMLLLLMRELSGSKYDYLLIFFENGSLVDEFSRMGYRTVVIQTRKLRNLINVSYTIGRLVHVFRKEQSDLVVSWMPKAHIYAGIAAWLSRIPSIWVQHGVSQGHWIDRVATAIPAAMVLCTSRGAAAVQGTFLPRRPLEVLYPPVDTRKFNQGAVSDVRRARERIGLPMQSRVIGTVARLQPQKGIHVLIQAYASLARVFPDLYCVIVGGEDDNDAQYATYLRRLCSEDQLRSRVLFLGHRDDIPEVMQAMDVVVLASVLPEGYGMVLAEAMALGKPVVGPNAGGCLEVISDGVDGLLVLPGCVSDLVQALMFLLSDPCKCRGMGEVAALQAKRFTPSASANAFEALVSRIA